MVDRTVLARNFSRYAHLYDRYADVQALAASRLMIEVPSGGLNRILEIGCGTGLYTRLLRKRFPSAHIKALDISARSIEIARDGIDGVEFCVCDGASVRIDEQYDLVTSNAVFQWFGDLKGAVANYRSALTKKGLLIFSAFGPETFAELGRCLGETAAGRAINSRRFAGRKILDEVLRKHFSSVRIDEMALRQEYGSLMELLNTIRYTGTRGDGASGGLIWKRGLVKEVEGRHRQHYGGIVASYQIFLCRAGL